MRKIIGSELAELRENRSTHLFVKVAVIIALCLVSLMHKFFPGSIAAPAMVALGFMILLLGSSGKELTYFRLGIPLIIVFLLGIQGLFTSLSYDALRDVTYALWPISLTFIGYWMAGKSEMHETIFRFIMVCGFIWSIAHLYEFIDAPELLTSDIEEIRAFAGRSAGEAVLLTIAIGLFQNKYKLGELFPRLLPRVVILPVCFLSLVLYYSRADLVTLLILLLALTGWMGRLKTSTVVVSVSIFAIGLMLFATTPNDETGTLRSKFVNSFSEISTVDYTSFESINEHWRAFETSRVIAAFSESSVLEQLAGQGFGATVDLGFDMLLGKEYLREIPIFHNGYAYTLVKEGILGLVCYAFFYIFIIRFAARYSKSANLEQRFLARLLMGCVLSLVVISYVVGGPSEIMGAPFVLMLGYLMRRISQREEASQSLVNEERINVARRNA
jgi:hypothetical protein